ncbi:MAG: HAD family phosphatase [Candidatus Sericytochromatia bacterium]|nr:HAD family phosphatase [Candidatus Sericytochromatia bacterium]
MEFAAVLFDMDGVVVDTMPLHRTVWRRFAAARGIHRTEEELRPLDGRRATDIIALLFDEQDPVRAAELAEAREALYREMLMGASLRAIPGAEAYLARLRARGVPRILATSATLENVDQVLGPLGLRAAFDGVVTAADVARGKPAPDVYHRAAALAGVPPNRCLVVEDAVPGIEAARAAGSLCLGLATSLAPEALLAAGARWVAPDLQALAAGQAPWERDPGACPQSQEDNP